MEKTVISAIIIGIVIVIVVAFIFLIGPSLYAAIKGLGFDQLPPNVKQNTLNNWNSFASNIKTCAGIVDYDCLCDGFPNFPGTFPSDFTIQIREGNISLFYKSEKVNSIVGEFKSADILEDKITVGGGEIIDFKGKVVDRTTYPVLSSIVPVITGKFYKKDPFTVAFVVSMALKEGQNNINNRTSCLQWRKSAITKFNDFTSCANSNQLNKQCTFSVKDAPEYNVLIGGTQTAIATLKFNQENVKDYNSAQKRPVNVYSDMLPLCDVTLLIVYNGDSVKIVSESGKVCLKRI